MTLKANIAKMYAAVVAQARTPHIPDQKAAGTPKGVTVIQCLTKIVDTVKPTTAWLYQGTTGSPMGVVNVPKTQQEDAKAMLCKVLYKIFHVKEKTITPESKDPIEVNALHFSGRHSTVNHRFYKITEAHDTGHTQALSYDKLMRSRECYHCHKKGHYTCNCHTRRWAASNSPEAIVICAMRSRPDMGILPMNQLTKRIQDNRHINSFNTLKEETLDETIPVAAPTPKLLDKQKLEELMAGYKAKQSPARAPSPLKVKMVQEFIKDNAHKFDEATCKQLANLCKPVKSKPSAQQMGDALKDQIPYMDEDTKIRMLNMLVPAIVLRLQETLIVQLVLSWTEVASIQTSRESLVLLETTQSLLVREEVTLGSFQERWIGNQVKLKAWLLEYWSFIYRQGRAWAIKLKVGKTGQELRICKVRSGAQLCCGLYEANNKELA